MQKEAEEGVADAADLAAFELSREERMAGLV